jgi:hypothetical protein
VGLKLNETHQLMVYTDDVNLLGDNTDAIKKNMETLIDVSREVGLEENTEKTKYMLLSRHQSAWQSNDIKIANKSFESVAKFRYLGTTITNQNLIQETEFGYHSCYHSVQNLLSSRLLSRNLKIRYTKQ